MDEKPKTAEPFAPFDCPVMEIAGEPQVGITVYLPSDTADAWLCWDETVALHKWLSKLIEETNNGR